jgi:hypothetical protein
MFRLKCLGYACLIAFGLAWGEGANAAEGSCPTESSEVKSAKEIQTAHPAMFKIVNGKSTVYLLGSIHVLPVEFPWCTPAMSRVIGKVDSFFFEANLDSSTTEFHYFMDQKGYLPRGQTLHQKLSPTALQQYVTLIRMLRIDPNKLDYLQPGVAVMLLQNVGPRPNIEIGPGVDPMLVHYAKQHGKQIGYLETLQSQFDVLTAIGGGTQVEILEKTLADLWKRDEKFRPMLAAWAKGDLKQLDSINEEDPDLRALLLVKRNRAWLPRIEGMLSVPKTYLVTVGAMHLTGSGSVIDLLCAKGWQVERIETGAAPSSSRTAGSVRVPLRSVERGACSTEAAPPIRH